MFKNDIFKPPTYSVKTFYTMFLNVFLNTDTITPLIFMNKQRNILLVSFECLHAVWNLDTPFGQQTHQGRDTSVAVVLLL